MHVVGCGMAVETWLTNGVTYVKRGFVVSDLHTYIYVYWLRADWDLSSGGSLQRHSDNLGAVPGS